MAIDQRVSPSPLLLLLLSLLIGAAAALASRRRWPFQRCFSLSGLCFLIHCENNDSLHSSCWPYWSWFWIYECFTYAFARQLNAFQTGDMLFAMWNSYILLSFAWCFSTVGYPGHSALERRLLYDFVIMDEHFKGQRCACVLLPAATRNNQSGLCTHCLLIFVFHLLFLVLLLVSHTGNLLRIAIFNISYIRGLFLEKYFNDKSVPALRDEDQEAYTNGCKALQTN
ncbi:uncharacterized protein LOC114280552 [Camellia sinensis]|uniref:uncharacterized protein LOC114280552 n=1 Tax=Camellia sinensis TaxID=4442 RepID=UPI001035B8C1|nr:uncharacterized protein LOC114280552 [Camellia sinensis]